MIRKHKKYVKPRQMFESERIKEENILVKKYGLRNKREIWKTQAKVNYFRSRAKELARKPIEEQELFINKLKALGLNVGSTSDVLDLKVEDLLNRRLPTIVVEKGFASTPLQARQMTVHKRVLINKKVLDSPSYIIPVAQENSISIKKKTKQVKTEPKEETQQEEKDEAE